MKFIKKYLKHFMSSYNGAGSISNRYRRCDALGTPWCDIIDYETINSTVTTRIRDTMEQEIIQLDKVVSYIEDKKKVNLNQDGFCMEKKNYPVMYALSIMKEKSIILLGKNTIHLNDGKEKVIYKVCFPHLIHYGNVNSLRKGYKHTVGWCF